MGWLRPQPCPDPNPAHAGLPPHRLSLALGRLLLVLPADGEPHSLAHHRGTSALLCGHLLHRTALRRRLALPADAPLSDAGLVLAAYQAWGTEAASHLDGAFAALVWDQERDRLLGIRDATGLVPLFYARTQAGGLVLSSDVFTLLRHPQVSGEIDRVVVAEWMLDRLTQVEETFFAAVRRVPGAHQLEGCGTQVKVRRYWDPCPLGEPIAWLASEEVERFGAVLEEAVAGCLEVGAAGISLSAGIDSVSVAAVAAEVAGERGYGVPHGLSVRFAGRESDESEGQRGVAEALGMPFRLLEFEECLGGRPLLEAALDLSPFFPSPSLSLWTPVWMRVLDEACSRGLRVVLTGHGGDEWLSVTPDLARDLIHTGDLVGLWRLYRASLEGYPLSPVRFGRRLLWREGLRPLLRDAALGRFPQWAGRLRRPVELPDWVAPDPDLRRALAHRLQPSPPLGPGDSAYARGRRAELQHPLVMIDLEETYYRACARGITSLHPYWSRPVVEFLLRTPPGAHLVGGQLKGLARRLLDERLPGLDVTRQKKITMSALRRQVVASQWEGIWRRWRADCALSHLGVADAGELERVMRAVPSGRVGPIAAWLSAEAWLRGQRC